MLLKKAISLILCETLVLSSSVFCVQGSPVDAPKAEAVAESNSVEEPALSDEELVSFEELDDIENEYKLSLERQKEELPDTITARNEGGEIIEVTVEDWVPNCDYDEYLGEYEFSPVVDEDLILSEDLELPTVTVFVENEEEPDYSGYQEIDLGYEVPVLGDSFFEVNADSNTADIEIKDNDDSYYNGFEAGYLPEVRNQGGEGACWAFASIGAVESDLIKNSAESSSLNLSELQLCYYETHEYEDPTGANPLATGDRTIYKGAANTYINNGGTAAIAYRLFGNGVGPVEEKYAPYSAAYSYTPDSDDALNRNYGRIKNAYNISSSDHEAVKSAILKHGGVTASFYSSSGSFYSATYNSYYQTRYTDVSTARTNHEIMIVGWDDSFPATNYKTGTPEADGAWLVRNSYGLDDYGFNGYFWLSYYDASLLKSGYMTAYDVEKVTFDNTYSYVHEFARTGVQKKTGTLTASTGYNVGGNQSIKAVGIELASANNTVKAEVTAGDVTRTGVITTSHAGYYTIPLQEALDIETTTEVTVTFTISSTTNSYNAIIFEYASSTTEVNYSNINYKYVCNKPTKVNGSYMNYDLLCQLYTDDKAVSGESPEDGNYKLSSEVIYEYGGSAVALSLLDKDGINPASVDADKLSWTSSASSVATVDNTGLVTLGYSQGSCIVRCKYNGKTVGECTVSVRPRFIDYVVTDDVRYGSKAVTYYPNADNSNYIELSVPYRPGYEFVGWSFEADFSGGTFKRVLTSTLLEKVGADERVRLYPKWNPLELCIKYYVPESDLSGFKDNVEILGTVTGEEVPVTTESLLKSAKNPLDYIAELNVNNEYYFNYFSSDPEGKNPVTTIDISAYNFLRKIKNGSSGSYYVQSSFYYLYPQFKKYPQLDEPIPSVASEHFVEEGQVLTITSEEVVCGLKIYYEINSGDYKLYNGPISLKRELFDEEGALYIHYYAEAPNRSRSKVTSLVYYYKAKEDLEAWGEVDPDDIINYAKEFDKGTPVVEMIDDAGFWLGGVGDTKYYTGKAVTFEGLKVYFKNKILTLNKDYTVQYANNVVAATSDSKKPPTIIINGKGGYSGKFTQTFTINKTDISEVVSDPGVIYGFYNKGKVVTPSIKLTATLDGVSRSLGKNDYIYACNDPFDGVGCSAIGEHTLIVRGKGNYCGQIMVTYMITSGVSISKTSVSLPKSVKLSDWQTGTNTYLAKPEVTVSYGKGNVLTKGVEYTLEYSNNDRIGTATVTITGNGNSFIGTRTLTFKITGTSIATGYKVEGFTSSFVYSGSDNIQTGCEVEGLVKNVDYTVSYNKDDRTSAGTYYMIITGTGRYCGTIKKKFTVAPYDILSDTDGKISVSVSDAVYSKAGAKPVPKVMFGARELVAGVDFTYSYLNNTKATDEAIVLIKGKGNFKGAQSLKYLKNSGRLEAQTFKISPLNISVCGKVEITTTDVKYNSKLKPLQYKNSFTLKDPSGKVLKAGTDYYNGKGDIVYSLDKAGENVLTNDSTVEIGTVIYVTVKGKGNYCGTITGSYRVCRYLISEMKVSVSSKAYTGKEVYLSKADISLAYKNVLSESLTYNIAGDYTNNINKGTAKVTLVGTGEVGGKKTISFKIVDVSMYFKLVLNPSGGSGTMNSVKTYSKSVTIPNCTYKRSGYYFAGWSLNQNSIIAEYSNKDIYEGCVPGETVTLYAVWRQK